MAPVLVHEEDAVCVITLNRPERLNALDAPCRRALLEALTAAAAKDAVRVVVLTGAGRAFCTGQDVTAAEELQDAGATVRDTYNPLVVAIREMPKPVIAAVNGPAVGAGLGLALSCDLRLLADGAYLACSFSRVALVPDTGTTVVLLRQLGHALAFDAARTARRIEADEALGRGLVNEVVEGSALLERALELAAELAQGPALAYALTKQLLVTAADDDEYRVLELEANSQGLAAASEEHAAAIAAFLTRSR
jgi:2-(1,2-epoxy-1,2-dihydrophenyl)acetyl-CoA isomerase